MKIKNQKKTFALATSALALSAAFVGCSDYCEFTAGDLRMEKTNKEYDEAFVKRFGTPDPDHDWGFGEIGEIQSLGGGISQKTSRAGTIDNPSSESKIIVNINEWTNRTISDGKIVYADNALAKDIQIPGWPHLNGLYYGSDGEQSLKYTVTHEELVAERTSETEPRNLHNARPVGDLTEYEIQYVSKWFRTHPKGSIPQENLAKLHLSDFFIQNVCCDADQLSYNENPGSEHPTWWNGNNGTNVGYGVSYNLDQLGFKDVKGTWTHVNNFNANGTNYNPEESLSNPNRTIQYVTSSGTEGFRCWPSWSDSEGRWLDREGIDWVLVHLTWTETTVNEHVPESYRGNYVREGYYLAFDFSGHNGTNTYEGDGYFSNWIVKITPGTFNPTSPNVKRVMCEDLGGSLDFDFNDVVFDVGFDSNGGTIIVVQAAGGTMPIMVDKDPKLAANASYEVHQLMGAPSMTPVNVKRNGLQHEVAIYRGKDRSSINKEDRLKDVEVWVKNTQKGTGDWNEQPYKGGEHEYFGLESSEYNKKTSIAPRAFAVPLEAKMDVINEELNNIGLVVETAWMQEEQHIESSYYCFDEWVADKTATFGAQGGTNRGWWEQANNQVKLYRTQVKSNIEGEGIETKPALWSALMLPKTKVGDDYGQSNYHLVLDRTGEYDDYDDQDKILNVFQNSDAYQCTFTIVLATATENANIEAILIPANVKKNNDGTTTLSYKGNNFLTYTDAADFKEKAITGYDDGGTHHNPVFTKWHTAIQQTNVGTDGKMNGKYIYTVRFSFTKDQLTESGSGHTLKLSEYLLLYINSNLDDVEIPVVSTDGTGKTVEWYIHY